MDERKKLLRKAGLQISVYMGITMSFFLSLIENVLSGHFDLALFLATFALSTTLSLIIGFVVPIALINSTVAEKLGAGTIAAKIVSSLISDLIYTPVLTLAMVSVVRVMLPREAIDNLPSLPKMFIGSLIPAMIIGFILIMIFIPLFQKIVTANLGLDRPPEPRGKAE